MTQVAAPSVTVVAYTHADYAAMHDETDHVWSPYSSTKDADALAEFAGRSCYQSWTRPNPRTKFNRDYIGHILEVGHLSVIEHATVSFYIAGVSRSFTHELVRHRHLSFSQLSQRYVDESDARYVLPPAIQGDHYEETLLKSAWDQAQGFYTLLVEHLESKGMQRKQAREAARSVLPNMTETKVVVTGNHRSWREFVAKRASGAADAEIRRIAVLIFRELAKLAPAIYQDMEEYALADGSHAVRFAERKPE